jgi:nucleotide-binding universal stress UspA family protein
VVHVASAKELTGASAMEIQKTRKEKRQKLDEICDILDAAGTEARAHVYIGEPVEEIEKAAREHQATMIALGSSAKPAWAEKWIGSIPKEIAEKSIYPTLLIPPEQE